MIRGFLNSSKAKERPLGPVPDDIVAAKRPAPPAVAEASKNLFKYEVEKNPQPHESDNANNQNLKQHTYTSQPRLPIGSSEPQTECILYPGTKEPFFDPRPLVHPQPAFRLDEVPGKGKGLFSTRALNVGDRILIERPLLICPAIWLIPTLEETERLVHGAVERMRPENRDAFMALANCHTEDGSGPLVGVVRTNTIGVTICGEGLKSGQHPYCAILKDITRLNHSCSPNTHPVFDESSLSFTLFAVRDIAEGEELTFYYCHLLDSSAQRNAKLASWGFVCTCPSCRNTPASDARREAFLRFPLGSTPNQAVLIWAADRTLADDWLLNKCREQIALVEIEGVQVLRKYFDIVWAMMEVYIALGDAENASKYAAKLGKFTWLKDRNVSALSDSTNTAVYEAHPIWRMRVGAARPGPIRDFQEFAADLASKGVRLAALPEL